jgi:glycosyltransferase involved in cell wall biosynthesis
MQLQTKEVAKLNVKNGKYTFSVIIPHKNTPNLLKRCLESIPRTEDIQIIVVDDNSDEKLVDFRELTDLKDGFVEVYLTKEGKGAGYARNVGLKHAKGNWLIFADADDFFVENAFERLFAQKDVSQEIVYFKSDSCYSDNISMPATRNLKFNKLANDYILAQNKYAEDYIRYLWSVPWAKMVKRELVERQNIAFDETPVANDVMFSCLVGHYAATVKAVDEIIYTATVNMKSVTNRKNFMLRQTMIKVFFKRNAFLKKIGKSHISPSLLRRLFQKVFGAEKIRKEKVVMNNTHLNRSEHKIACYKKD